MIKVYPVYVKLKDGTEIKQKHIFSNEVSLIASVLNNPDSFREHILGNFSDNFYDMGTPFRFIYTHEDNFLNIKYLWKDD